MKLSEKMRQYITKLLSLDNRGKDNTKNSDTTVPLCEIITTPMTGELDVYLFHPAKAFNLEKLMCPKHKNIQLMVCNNSSCL